MDTNQYEERIYKVMKYTLALRDTNPATIAKKCDMELKELLGCFDFIDREGLLSGLQVIRAGQGNLPTMVFTSSVMPTLQGNNFMKQFEKTGIPCIMLDKRPTVFISYNKESGTDFVDSIESKLKTCAIVKRYTEDMKPWDSFTKFMKTIRSQDFAILVITEKYLKSVPCMFEVSELMKDDDWKKKTMFAVLDEKVYSMKLELIEYWQKKRKELDEKARTIELANMASTVDEANRIDHIKLSFDSFITTICDSNNPKPWDLSDAIISRIKCTTYIDNVSLAEENQRFAEKKQEEIDRLLE